MTENTCKMKNNALGFILLAALILLVVAAPLSAAAADPSIQVDPSQTGKLKVYADLSDDDLRGLQESMGFVQFVKSVEQAEVVIEIQLERQDDGSIKKNITFRGKNRFENDDDRISLLVGSDFEGEASGKKLAQGIKMTLMRYAGKTPLRDRLSIGFQAKVKPTDVVCKWDFWVFSLNASTWMNGESLYKSAMLYGSVSAVRVTPDLKVRLSIGGMNNVSEFSYDGTEIDSSSNSRSFSGMIVKSIDDHWSVGAYLGAAASSYGNTDFSLSPAPAVEYDLFPYSQSTKRQLRFLYRIGLNLVDYTEETIYQKTKESLLKESLSVTLFLKQKWGTATASLEGSHYFHDFSKNRLVFNGDLSFRLLKGLNLNLDINYSRINDQLSLPRGGASLEEILLQRRELETTYRYGFSVGISYTFGSTKSSVVNPRFGSSGGGISISF
ncbi:MAG: hypothetical protein KKD56_03845 [Acidobacteria bacterium]|nr:hypothetical protein [Acidobacteriota bacterium]MCG2815164.1 hypothetical protein [Candidatus Aminicenantes bacterium]MBU1338183.1 hypothetical protein [Acidobacteriota bacterium]MBU1474429.1 hypothetical protein [Acidobacteriota bacterium]MBU4254926.1 hypothetical protein [Acidobacteriota bacterium]